MLIEICDKRLTKSLKFSDLSLSKWHRNYPEHRWREGLRTLAISFNSSLISGRQLEATMKASLPRLYHLGPMPSSWKRPRGSRLRRKPGVTTIANKFRQFPRLQNQVKSELCHSTLLVYASFGGTCRH